MRLTNEELAMLRGEQGPAAQIALRILTALGEAAGAPDFVPVTRAHVGADMPGQSTIDWLQTLRALGGRFAVPTTLNIASFDMLHPDLYRGSAAAGADARTVMQLYVDMGGEQTWTCAPYLLDSRPHLGEHIAWSESGAVVFANAVLGARTDRGGIFSDVCAALTGRVPRSGLHVDRNRVARVRIRIDGFSDRLLAEELTFHLLGYWAGTRCGDLVPVLENLGSAVTDEQLQVLGAAFATSGGLGMFHVAGRTPEAATVDAAFGDHSGAAAAGAEVWTVCPADLYDVRRELSSDSRRIDAVCLGTPQFSLGQFRELLNFIDRGSALVNGYGHFYVNTSRHVLRQLEAEGLDVHLFGAGVTVITDTCSYLAPVIDPAVETVMTNSAKWAHYGGPQRGVDVVLGSTLECVRTAQTGALWLQSSA